MNANISFITFREISTGNYSVDSQLMSKESIVDIFNKHYYPGVVDVKRKIVNDFHGMVGYSEGYIHHMYGTSVLLSNGNIKISTFDDDNDNSVSEYDINPNNYCILRNQVQRTDGVFLDFTYLHPLSNTGSDLKGISIVPPAPTNRETTSKASEFYLDAISLYNQLMNKWQVKFIIY